MSSRKFEVISPWPASGDQPEAIKKVVEYFDNGQDSVVLHGATGTGKSATTAWIIEKLNMPTLILTPNKVLAAQLATELRELLPNNAVRFFVSHFAYYRPEAYMPTTDTFIEKDSAIDDSIERLRHEATTALLTRKDTVIVSSVSAIYGLGRPEEYLKQALEITAGESLDRDTMIKELVKMNYMRNDEVLERGRFRVRGDTVDIIPADSELAIRINFFGDEVESLALLEPISLSEVENPPKVLIFPQTHHMVNEMVFKRALLTIKAELAEELEKLEKAGKILEAQRLKHRTNNDLEQLELTGTCKGIENYSRHFDERSTGSAPSTLVDYFPKDFLLVLDESHQTAPQVEAMYHGDQSRKRTLVEFGFRLPSALDNRPLKGEEFWKKISKTLFLSATPAERELTKANGAVVDLMIRPTGLVDPEVVVLPNKDRLLVLAQEIKDRVSVNERTLITTLTKRQAEQLNDFLIEQNFKTRFLHSEIDTVERIQILRELRSGKIDVLVGVNLLREGLDLPEVSLVAVLDADTEGFLRSATSLIQTIGRAARNPRGKVILFADRRTPAMEKAIDETNKRRAKQVAHNLLHGITPKALIKPMVDLIYRSASDQQVKPKERDGTLSVAELIQELESEIQYYAKSMKEMSKNLRFEEAAAMRDQISELQKELKELREIAR